MRWTRSLSMVTIGLALSWSAARAQGPMQPGGYPYPMAAPAYPEPPAGPVGPGCPPLPAQPAEPPLGPGGLPTAPIHPATQFPTPVYHDLNGVTDGSNSFSGEPQEDCHPCLIADLEYLGWWMRRFHAPPLVTSGPPNGVTPGALGSPFTRSVLGGEISPDEMNGGRARLEYLFPNAIDPCTGCYLFGHAQYLSVEGSFFGLEDRTQSLNTASDPHGSPALGRPFFNTARGLEDVDPISQPRVLAGAADVQVSSKLYGGEANVRVTQYGGDDNGSRLGILAGARYLALDQALRIDTFSHDLGPGPVGSNFVSDQFGTHNKFYGGQVGLDVKFYWWDRVDLDVVGKVAFGPNQETLHIDGQTVVTNPGGFSNNRGLFAQPGNVGRYSQQEFIVVPEVTATLGVRVATNVRVYAGYNFLYLTDALQPGQEMNNRVSVPTVGAHGGPAPLLGAGAPPAFLSSTDFWVQGVVAGVELSY